MPDPMDRVQQHAADMVADALRQHHARDTVRRPGLSECEQLDCREPIEPARTRLGARLCDDCQRIEDIRANQFARGRG